MASARLAQECEAAAPERRRSLLRQPCLDRSRAWLLPEFARWRPSQDLIVAGCWSGAGASKGARSGACEEQASGEQAAKHVQTSSTLRLRVCAAYCRASRACQTEGKTEV